MKLHFEKKMKFLAMLYVQTTRNGFHFRLQHHFEFISGKLKTWHCKRFSFHLEMKFHDHCILNTDSIKTQPQSDILEFLPAGVDTIYAFIAGSFLLSLFFGKGNT